MKTRISHHLFPDEGHQPQTVLLGVSGTLLAMPLAWGIVPQSR